MIAPGHATRAGLGPYRPGRAMLVACFGAFLAFIDSTVVNIAFPSIRSAFPHSSFGTLSWVLNGYNVVFAGLLVLSGLLADLVGRKRMFMAGLVVFVVTSAACAAAPSVGLLVAFRVFQGAGAAMLVPASLAIVVQTTTQTRRSEAIALWGAAAALAAGLGPPIGGLLVDAYNWRLVFLVNLPLGALGWVLARRSVVESRAPGRRRLPDVRGALAVSVGLGALTLGIVQGSAWGWSSAGTVAAFVVAALGIAATVASSVHHPVPIFDSRLLRIRAYGLSLVITVALGLGLYTYLLTHILWLHYVWHYSLVLAGLSVAPGALVATLVARPFGHLADRFGTRAVAVPGALVWAGAYWWYSTRVGLTPDFVGQWLPGQLLSGIGVGATLPVVGSGGLATVPAGRYATASAATTMARQIGGVLGVAILTVLIAHPSTLRFPGELRHGWELAGWAFVAAAALGLFFGRVRPAGEIDADQADPVLHLHLGDAGDAGDASSAPALVLADGPGQALDFLAGLSPDARRRLDRATTAVFLPAGATLFSEGEPGDAMYLLEAGRLEVHVPTGERRQLAAGSNVGELALLTGSVRSATVVAVRDSLLRRLAREDFDELSAADPSVTTAVARNLAVQLQRSRPLREAHPAGAKVIAVVPLRPGAPADAVADLLAEGVRATRRVVRLVDPGPEELQAAEATHDAVIVTPGPGGAEPVRRQGDRVVLVTDDPDPDTAGLLPPGGPPTEVVVVGPRPTTQQIARWHERTGCRRVYAAGPDRAAWAAGLTPLTARLSGRSIALVLGGGGARGLAHLGLLWAFEEAGIRVDRLAGTSSGALIAASYASLGDASETDRVAYDEFVVAEPLRGLRPSSQSLLRADRVLAGLRRRFAGRRVEALDRELVVVSTDLYGRRPIYHRTGPLDEALAASIAIPVLLPTRRLDGLTLVDGGLADNLPVGVFDPAEGPVIAVRVVPPPSPAGPGRPPRLREVVMRLVELSDRDSAGATALLTVLPDTRGIGFLEFHQIDAARTAGHRAGVEAVRQLREALGDWVVGGPGVG